MNNQHVLEIAIKYIETHLNEDIGLEDVARETGYSYYHMTRLFKIVVGETVGNYITKRRLSNSTKELIYTKKKIIDIAIESGYNSSESYSRAFKEVYNISPLEYRKNKNDLYIGSKKELDIDLLQHIANNLTITPRIVELSEVKVAGVRGATSLKDNSLPLLWEQYHKIRSLITHTTLYRRDFCICESVQTTYTKYGDAVYLEMIGTEVDSFEDNLDMIETKVIAAGKYAVFTHIGNLTSLYQTYNYIWGTWFLSTKEELDNREDFEMYTDKIHNTEDPNNKIDIYIPIK
jgi:AraC family transcriptional regulator